MTINIRQYIERLLRATGFEVQRISFRKGMPVEAVPSAYHQFRLLKCIVRGNGHAIVRKLHDYLVEVTDFSVMTQKSPHKGIKYSKDGFIQCHGLYNLIGLDIVQSPVTNRNAERS